MARWRTSARRRRLLAATTVLAVVAAGATLSGPAQAMAPTPVFSPYLDYEVGSGKAVATGDFSGDGRTDIVMTTAPTPEQPGGALHVFAQRADGWLDHAEVLVAGLDAGTEAGLHAGDLDGDGRSDAVVATGHSLVPFLQRAGRLTPGPAVTVEGASRVQAADLDGDGRVDLVGYGTAGVAVLRGTGAGAFASPAVVTTERQREVAVGDVNGDGRRDLVTCNGTVVVVFAQLANGTFGAPTEYRGDIDCNSVAVADVNGDGRADVALVGGGSIVDSRLDVFPQRPDGTLAATPTTYRTEYSPLSVKATDTNADGRTDLVVLHHNHGLVGVHAQAPDGSLDPERTWAISGGYGTPDTLTLGDVNGDARPDVVVAGSHHGLTLLWGQRPGPSTTTSTSMLPTTVWRNPGVDPRPVFTDGQAYPVEAEGVSVATGDFNGDGRTDVAMATGGQPYYGDRTFKLFVAYQAADGSLQRMVTFDTDGAFRRSGAMVLGAGDLDGDGRTDLVLRMSEGINVFMQRNGTFADRTFIELPRASRVDVADMDADGRADLVMSGGAAGGLTLHRSLGAGTFAPPVSVPAPFNGELAIGDVTGDGRPDIVSVDDTAPGYVVVNRQLPDGGYTPDQYPAGGTDGAPVLGDFNGDGRLDVAVLSWRLHGPTSRHLVVLEQGAGGVLTQVGDTDVMYEGRMLAGDVDGDGRTDLVTAYGSVVGVRLQEGGRLGSELPWTPMPHSSGYPPTAVALGDLTGDGRLDLAAANRFYSLDIARNISTGVPRSAPSGTFHPLPPQRILDTRTGLGAPAARLGPGGTIDLQVTGAGGVPVDGASAVVLNVTVTEPTGGSYLTAWPAGSVRPLASNLNWTAGQTVPNLVTAMVGAGGKVSLYNGAGSAHVIADVAGWYGADSPTPGSRYAAVPPARILDTRAGVGAPVGRLGPGATAGLQVTGRGGVPASGVSAVALNVTVTEPTATSFLTAWPAGDSRPVVSSLNYVAGQTVPNLVVVKVGAGGMVNLFNFAGAAHVIADVAGWFGPGAPPGGAFTAVAPERILDTRAVVGKIGPGGTFSLQVTDRGGVPAYGVSAVVLNVTVTEPTATSFLTAWPWGDARPLASNLNYVAGQTVANLVVVKVSAGGTVELFNHAGAVHIVADVAGWFG